MPTFDGLKRREIKADTISGTNLFATGSITAGRAVITTGTVTTENFTTASGTTLYIAGSASMQGRGITIGNVGSPAAWSNFYVQVGSAATDAASVAWVAFPEGFASAGYSVTTTSEGTASRPISIVLGSKNAGSFFAISHGGASVVFEYIAAGPR